MAAPSRWWSRDTVAVVTGSNKGIGFEIVKQLAEKGLTVILTARDEGKGIAAVERLKNEGLIVKFHILDVLILDSIANLAAWLQQNFGGLDILINNAAITDQEETYSCAQMVLETNYKAVKMLTRELLPLFKGSTAGARIVNISSCHGKLEKIGNPSLRQEIGNIDTLTEDKIDKFVESYLTDAKDKKVGEAGWSTGAYSVSKMALNAYTRVLARSLKERQEGEKIYVNCVSPGFCKTDMTNNQGLYTAAQGAETAVWVALLPSNGPTGQHFSQKNVESF
ncbi:hypothetical protein KP509_38G064100 [Ceratopteris richardii]|uniref:Uncharacterized protein n=1 Tax=Ceratopteris richardii TaxID=49495 RepID=A0A8T2Q5I4_CERRI|nr:hypothetical protein KP509_38G064100 [Ceratopteris richardii]